MSKAPRRSRSSSSRSSGANLTSCLSSRAGACRALRDRTLAPQGASSSAPEAPRSRPPATAVTSSFGSTIATSTSTSRRDGEPNSRAPAKGGSGSSELVVVRLGTEAVALNVEISRAVELPWCHAVRSRSGEPAGPIGSPRYARVLWGCWRSSRALGGDTSASRSPMRKSSSCSGRSGRCSSRASSANCLSSTSRQHSWTSAREACLLSWSSRRRPPRLWRPQSGTPQRRSRSPRRRCSPPLERSRSPPSRWRMRVPQPRRKRRPRGARSDRCSARSPPGLASWGSSPSSAASSSGRGFKLRASRPSRP